MPFLSSNLALLQQGHPIFSVVHVKQRHKQHNRSHMHTRSQIPKYAINVTFLVIIPCANPEKSPPPEFVDLVYSSKYSIKGFDP